jgi:DNA-binding transcriptional ArsR family regulator
LEEDRLKEEITLLHAQICSGLADPIRILILYSLSESPKNVNELAKRLKLPQPTISRHLKILRERGIARTERDAQNIIYSLADIRIIQALNLLRASLADILQAQATLAQGVNGIDIEKQPEEETRL